MEFRENTRLMQGKVFSLKKKEQPLADCSNIQSFRKVFRVRTNILRKIRKSSPYDCTLMYLCIEFPSYFRFEITVVPPILWQQYAARLGEEAAHGGTSLYIDAHFVSMDEF